MASVLGHMTVTHQYITRNLNPESSRSSFAPRRRPSRVMSEQSERPQWAAEHTQTMEHAQGVVTYQVPPSVKQRLDVPLSAAWLVVAEGDLRVLRHHGEVRTARRPDGRALLQVRECEVRLEGRPAHLARVELGRDQLEQRVSLAANEVVLF